LSLPGKRTEIKFGTDGWRAIIADGFTFANLERVAQAYADYLTQTTQAASTSDAGERTSQAQPDAAWPANMLTVVGYDRRFLSEQFARRAAEILAGNGFQVAIFDDAVPTPLISWAVREQRALGGVVITASHNPAEFNGFKIKAPWGGSASPEMTAAVESLLDQREPRRAQLPLTLIWRA
jgi:phosphomannomutase